MRHLHGVLYRNRGRAETVTSPPAHDAQFCHGAGAHIALVIEDFRRDHGIALLARGDARLGEQRADRRRLDEFGIEMRRHRRELGWQAGEQREARSPESSMAARKPPSTPPWRLANSARA